MSRTVAVAVREITERRSVLIAALVAGLLPFATPLLPGVRADRVVEARDAWALAIALSFGGATALAMGATAIARDLSEGRLTFDFARPLSWAAIWGGRFLGALLLTVLVLAATLVPTLLVGGLLPSLSGTNVPLFLLAALGALLALVPLAHAASIAIRSGSRWLAVDLACGVVFVLIVAWVARSLFLAIAWRTLTVAMVVIGSLAVVVLWVASAAQVSVGRTDLARGHAAQSRTVWSCLLALAAVLAGYTGWLLTPTPGQLANLWGMSAPQGTWMVISGDSPGRGDYTPAMLFDTATGSFLRLGAAARLAQYFSADGTRAILTRQIEPRSQRSEIVVAELRSGGAVLRDTSLGAVSPFAPITVSDDGHRLATLDDAIVSVYDVDSGKTLASVKFPYAIGAKERFMLYFAGPDRLRLCAFRASLELFELDVVAKQIAKTGEAPLKFEFPALQVLPGDRLFFHEFRVNEHAYLLDARTGAVVQTYDAPAGGKSAFRPLWDGRVVAIDRGENRRTIRVLSASGAVERSTEVDEVGRMITGGEVAPGQLVLGVAASTDDFFTTDKCRLLLLDADSGTIRETKQGIAPMFYDYYFSRSITPPGAPSTRLFRATNGLVFHDPLTGETRTLAGHGPA